MGTNDINNFLNDPENAKCKAFLTMDTTGGADRCASAATSGAGCGALSVVGASQSPGCQTTSENLKQDLKDLTDCQAKLYNHTTQFMIKILSEGEQDLFQILKDESEIFATELDIAKETIDGEVKILEMVSMLNLGILLLIVIFLLLIKTFY
tara:strand:+ start:157 stop:612 length:456 start_codon:yes stop_codon:yes gene_type:complete